MSNLSFNPSTLLRTQFICSRCIRTLRTTGRPSTTKNDRSNTRKRIRAATPLGLEGRSRPVLGDARNPRQPAGLRPREERRPRPRSYENSKDRNITRMPSPAESVIRRLHGTDRNALARMTGTNLREQQRKTSRSSETPDRARTTRRSPRWATPPDDYIHPSTEDFPFMPANVDAPPQRTTNPSNVPPSIRQTPIQLPPETASSYQPTFLINSIPPNLLASYNDTTPPTSIQLAYGTRFFTTSNPTFLHSSTKFRTLPMSSVPEVAFLGRSNVGKSSLLNALVHRTGMRIANVSGKPGRTKSMNAFGVGGDDGGVRMVGGRTSTEQGKNVGDEEGYGEHAKWIGKGGLVVLDMPGYGKSSRDEWGKEIVKYLTERKQLRKTFVLINAVHGVKASDLALLTLLSRNGIAHQIVLSKIDKIIHPLPKTSYQTVLRHTKTMHLLCRRVLERIQSKQGRGLKASGDVLTCSAEKAWPVGSGRKMGIENLRWAVLRAVGLECDAHGNKRVVDVGVQQEVVEDETVGVQQQEVEDATTTAGKTTFPPRPPRLDRDAVVRSFATRRPSSAPRESNYTPRRPPRLDRSAIVESSDAKRPSVRRKTNYTPRPLLLERGAVAENYATRRPSASRETEPNGDSRGRGQQFDRRRTGWSDKAAATQQHLAPRRNDWSMKPADRRETARSSMSLDPRPNAKQPWMGRGSKASKVKMSKGGRRAVRS